VKLFTSSLKKPILGGLLASALFSTTVLYGQAPQKNWKDQAEYDIYQKIVGSQSPDEQLQLLKQWEEKYPGSDFKLERAQTYLVVYNKKNDGAGVYQSSKNLLTIDPKSFQALYFLTLLTVSLNKNDADGLETGAKSANALIGLLDGMYTADKKPANISEADWKKQRTDIEIAAYKTIGWVEQQKKDYVKAEEAFKKGLDIGPGYSELSYLLGTVIVLQKKPERQAEAMWHFARAGNLDGPSALDAARRAQVAAYFKRVFTAFAGDDPKEMQSIIDQAKAAVYPPPGFKIKSKEEKMLENEEKFKSENPMLYMFMQVKGKLTAADGEGYWGELKDSELPEMKGKLVSHKPETNPKELIVAISTADQPEVTLVLEAPLRGKAEPGIEISFVGVAKEYTKDPFSLKVEVENEKLKGWPVQAAAPKTQKKGGPASKKGGVKKK
jgi:tetratricopeptide (TPR) repeat protein